MSIGKGTGWAYPASLAIGAAVFADDHSLFFAFNAARRNETPLDPVGLTGGSLWKMLGGPSCPGRLHTADALAFPCDLVRVETDHDVYWFANALLARTRLWRRALVAMNSQDLGPYRFGHRAHPGDGLVDVYESDLSFQQRILVAKRARLGAHLPHPGISERRVARAEIVLDAPRSFSLDGIACGRSRRFSLEVEPDALTVVV